tara:strand:+ start:62310 stop:62522 length:213 start_codon:yes stop_codon:yes gene_type:complete
MSSIKKRALEQIEKELSNSIRLDIPKLKKALEKSRVTHSEVFEHINDPSEDSILHNLVLLALPSPSQKIH